MSSFTCAPSDIRKRKRDALGARKDHQEERPEIARDAEGTPIAAAEAILALYLLRNEGGRVNIPFRGVEPKPSTSTVIS